MIIVASIKLVWEKINQRKKTFLDWECNGAFKQLRSYCFVYIYEHNDHATCSDVDLTQLFSLWNDKIESCHLYEKKDKFQYVWTIQTTILYNWLRAHSSLFSLFTEHINWQYADPR